MGTEKLESVEKVALSRNFQILSEKNEEGGGILDCIPTSSEFFAAQIWKLQANDYFLNTLYDGDSFLVVHA